MREGEKGQNKKDIKRENEKKGKLGVQRGKGQEEISSDKQMLRKKKSIENLILKDMIIKCILPTHILSFNTILHPLVKENRYSIRKYFSFSPLIS